MAHLPTLEPASSPRVLRAWDGAECFDGPAGLASARFQAWISTKRATETFNDFQRLAAETFPQGTMFAFAVEADPEAEEDSAVCVATLPPEHPVKALAYYNQFVATWARQADPRLSGLFTLLVRSPADDRS